MGGSVGSCGQAAAAPNLLLTSRALPCPATPTRQATHGAFVSLLIAATAGTAWGAHVAATCHAAEALPSPPVLSVEQRCGSPGGQAHAATADLAPHNAPAAAAPATSPLRPEPGVRRSWRGAAKRLLSSGHAAAGAGGEEAAQAAAAAAPLPAARGFTSRLRHPTQLRSGA